MLKSNIIVVIIASLLWHLGGQGHKWARSIVFPGILAITKAICLSNPLALLYGPLLWLMIAGFSYGVTSPIHKFWAWVFKKGEKGDYLPVEAATRATCGFFWGLPAVVFAILTGNWILFGAYLVLSTVLVTLFGLHSNVKVSELGTGAAVSCSIFI